ncbi:hypothetical protein GCM10009678_93550 [Actinomadura kijaniata]
MDLEGLLLPEKRAWVTSKGGATEWVHWQSRTARLLPGSCAVAGRCSSPSTERGRGYRPWTCAW